MTEGFDLRKYVRVTFENMDGEWGCGHHWQDRTPECQGYEDAKDALAAIDRILAERDAALKLVDDTLLAVGAEKMDAAADELDPAFRMFGRHGKDAT